MPVILEEISKISHAYMYICEELNFMIDAERGSYLEDSSKCFELLSLDDTIMLSHETSGRRLELMGITSL